jgi:hypothetical protein
VNDIVAIGAGEGVVLRRAHNGRDQAIAEQRIDRGLRGGGVVAGIVFGLVGCDRDAEPKALYRFRPFPKRGGIVTNELINKLREDDAY